MSFTHNCLFLGIYFLLSDVLFSISTNSLETEVGLLKEGRMGEELAQGLALGSPEHALTE